MRNTARIIVYLASQVHTMCIEDVNFSSDHTVYICVCIFVETVTLLIDHVDRTNIEISNHT